MTLFYVRSFSSSFPFSTCFRLLTVLCTFYVRRPCQWIDYIFVNNPPSCIRRICEFYEFLSVSDQIHTFDNLFFFWRCLCWQDCDFHLLLRHWPLASSWTFSGYVCTVHRCLFFEFSMSLSLSRQFLRVDSPTWPLGFLLSFSGIHLIWYLTMLSSYSITGFAGHWLRYEHETG